MCVSFHIGDNVYGNGITLADVNFIALMLLKPLTPSHQHRSSQPPALKQRKKDSRGDFIQKSQPSVREFFKTNKLTL